MSAQKTKCSTEDNNLYNEKLKQKITTQAKRLTKLAGEKEELLELLKEKTMTIDTSFSSCAYANKPRALHDYEIEKYKKELAASIQKIKELEKNKIELNNFKETISKRLSIANDDIDKTKIALSDIQKEKEELLMQINQNEIKIKSLKEENQNLNEQNKILENNIAFLQKEKDNLQIQITSLSMAQKEIGQNYEIQIFNLNEKNQKLFKDNRELSLQLQKKNKINSNLKTENLSLKSTNFNFTQKIDNLTNQINTFQKNIDRTLKVSTSLEIESKKNEFLTIIASKDLEISKLKELNNNYILLEEELSNSLKEQSLNLTKLKNELDKTSLENQKIKKEIEKLKKLSDKLSEDNSKLNNEVKNYKKTNEQLNSQFQSTSNLKNTQINNLKNYVELLEDKTVLMGKNKKYLEHLLIYTHPNSERVKQILEIYNEIVGLEVQKKNFEKEYIISKKGNEDDKNKLLKQQAINNIDEQIKMLKQSLKSMEDNIRIDKGSFN